MSFKNETLYIEQRFASGFTACTVKYSNVDYLPAAGIAWCELHVLASDSIRASIGDTALHRSTGVISINFYEPRNTGTAAGKHKADLAAAVFRDAQFNSITCRSPVITEVGEVNEWYVINMTVPYYRDEQF